MAWAKAGTNTLGGTTATMDLGTITSSNFNQMMTHYIPVGGNGAEAEIVCNSEATNEYARRYSINGTTDGTGINMPELIITGSNITLPAFKIAYFCNISGEEKLFIFQSVEQNTAGAGTPPTRAESVGKYDTTTGQINDFEIENTYWTGDYAIDSNVSVLGSDGVILPATISDGAIFHETDTNKSYVLYNGSWTEL